MHERALRPLVALLLALVGCSAIPGPTSPRTVTSDAVTVWPTGQAGSDQSSLESPTGRAAPSQRDPFNAELPLAFTRRLASEVGPRPAGSPGDARARALVAAELRAAGWMVLEEPFALPQGGVSVNVVAWRGELPQPGRRGQASPRPGPRPRRHVVIGAHLDTVEGSPGANDNASGVGVLVALARELTDETPGVAVVLVAFGAEEYQPSESRGGHPRTPGPRRHHVGSEQYAARYVGDVVAALSVDMVAKGDTTCICWLGEGPDTLAARLDGLAPPAGYAVRTEGDFSDHGPFAHRGLPAAVLWTGRDGVYHTPRDTADRLDVEDLRRAGDLTLAFTRDLTAADVDGLRRSAQR